MPDNAISGHTTHTVDGINWFYYRARLCDEFEHIKTKTPKWFLFDKDRNYVGYYNTRKLMLADIGSIL